MTDLEFDDYLNQRYKPSIDWYDKKSIYSKRWYYSLQSLVIFFTCITPILAVIGLRWPTTIIASIVALLTGLLKLLKFDENWIIYRTICESLKKEIHLYKADLSEYAQIADKKKYFVKRVENSISGENTMWLKATFRKKDDE